MDKSKMIIREGYLYREEKLNGQADVLYCVLKPNTLSFHRRKVHKRHTPLGLLKLEELSVDFKDSIDYESCIGVDAVDCNHNSKRFPWKVLAGEHILFLYCASLDDRIAWVDAIEQAKQSLCTVLSTVSTVKDCQDQDVDSTEDCTRISIERANEQSVLASEVNVGVDSDQLLSSKCIDNSSNTEGELNNSVRTTGEGEELSTLLERKLVTRVRSRSLSEVETPCDVQIAQEVYHLKSSSAPPDNGKRGFKTVDKLIDVHSGLCRQLKRDFIFTRLSYRRTDEQFPCS